MNPAILGVLLPLIQSFIKGKSGNELSDLLGNNKDIVAQLGGAGLGGGGGSDSALSALALLLPLLMKQNSVVVMGQSGVNPNLMTPLGDGIPGIGGALPGLAPSVPSQSQELPPPVKLTKTLKNIEKRLSDLEAKVQVEK